MAGKADISANQRTASESLDTCLRMPNVSVEGEGARAYRYDQPQQCTCANDAPSLLQSSNGIQALQHQRILPSELWRQNIGSIIFESFSHIQRVTFPAFCMYVNGSKKVYES